MPERDRAAGTPSESRSGAGGERTVLEDSTAATVAEGLEAAERQAPAEWSVGDLILDLYEVRRVFTSGGMGLVYQVRHRGWGMDLAVKTPRAEVLETAGGADAFVAEAETWVNLGLHPHVVTCHYVRVLGGIPRVFAEFVEGGSLADWIRDGRLYDGGPKAALERILDVAIQFAWGLAFAHNEGLVHQDVKPANLMMTPDGVAKVTDFGLAGARSSAPVELADGSRTVVVSSSGITPAYCSPEQATPPAAPRSGGAGWLTRRTDIWSWAVSMVEIFTGEVTWPSGTAAPAVLERYLEEGPTVEGPPPMPAGLVSLLRCCFERAPEDRPRDFAAVAASLEETYAETVGAPLSRPRPKPAELLADGLNNRAVSLLDLGQAAEAGQLFDRALQADRHHLEATLNRGLLRWRSGELTDADLLTRLQEIRTSHTASWRDELYVGLVHLERGDAEAALEVLEEAAHQAPEEREVTAALETARRGRGAWRRLLERFDVGGGQVHGPHSVALSPDGRRALTVGDDNLLCVWDTGSGRCDQRMRGHEQSVSAVAVTADFRWAASGGDDGVRFWDLEAGECVGAAEWPYAVLAVDISADGRVVVFATVGAHGSTLLVWARDLPVPVQTLQGHLDLVHSVKFLPGEHRAISAGWDKTLRLWDLDAGSCSRVLEGHDERVQSVAVDASGRLALSGSWDKTLKLWDLEAGHAVRTFRGHTEMVVSARMTPDGQRALSASGIWGRSGRMGDLRLWDLTSGRCLRTIDTAADPGSVGLAADGSLGVCRDAEGRLSLYCLEGSGPVAPLAVSAPTSSVELGDLALTVRRTVKSARSLLERGRPQEAAEQIAEARRLPGFERDPELVGLSGEAGLRGRCTGLAGGWSVRRLAGHAQEVTAVRFLPGGAYAVSASNDKRMMVWDLAAGERVRTIGHYVGEMSGWRGPPVEDVAVTPDGSRLFSASLDERLELWEAATGEKLATFGGHEGIVTAVDVTPDGACGLSGGKDRTLRLWDLATGACLRTFEGHRDVVKAVVVTPDGRQAVSVAGDRTLRVWDLVSGGCLRVLEGHTGSVEAVAIVPDGRAAVSAGRDQTARCWDLASGECRAILEGHSGPLTSVTVSPDGLFALSGGVDHTLRLWSLESAECLRVFEGHESPRAVRFDPEGLVALSGSGDGSLMLWQLDWEYDFSDGDSP